MAHMPRHWIIEYERGSNKKTPDNWKIKCASKPWYQNEVSGYYIRYNSNQRWELRHPYGGKTIYRGKPVILSSHAAAEQARALRGADQVRAEQQRRRRKEEQRAQREAKRQEEHLLAERELERYREYLLLQHEREEAQRQQALAAQQQREVAQQEARLRKFGSKPVPRSSQPQLPAGQFYLPSTIKVRIPESFQNWPTVEVYTADEGSACPLMGVYDKMDEDTRPRSWLIAHEAGNDAASEELWERKLGQRPWYLIQGSEHNFYIRYNITAGAWCLYDNFDNDFEDKWLCKTADTISRSPVDQKWVVHAKTMTIKEE